MSVEYVRITGVSTQDLDYPALTRGTMLTSNCAGQNITCLVGNNAEIIWSIFLKFDCKYPYGSAPELSKKEIRQRCENTELYDQALSTDLNWRDVWDRQKSVSMMPMEEGLRERGHWRGIVCIGGSMHKVLS